MHARIQVQSTFSVESQRQGPPCDVVEVKQVLSAGHAQYPNWSPARTTVHHPSCSLGAHAKNAFVPFQEETRSKHPHHFILHHPRVPQFENIACSIIEACHVVSGIAPLWGTSLLRYLGRCFELEFNASKLTMLPFITECIKTLMIQLWHYQMKTYKLLQLKSHKNLSLSGVLWLHLCLSCSEGKRYAHVYQWKKNCLESAVYSETSLIWTPTLNVLMLKIQL